MTRALKNPRERPADRLRAAVPGERGPGLDRSKRARDLVIDFKELEKKKQREYDKLDRMIKYAQSTKCRRSYILGYFGDHNTQPNAAVATTAARSPTDRRLPLTRSTTRRVARSSSRCSPGVARARGKFGKVAIAQMLIGSKSEKMDQAWARESLSTFGILADFNQPEIADLDRRLGTAVAGLVESSTDVDRFRPVIDISETGRDYLKSKGGLRSNWLADGLFGKVRNGGCSA